MIFSNKYIDYSKKTKIELYLTLILFLVLSNKTIVSIGKKLLHLSLAIKLPILGIIKKTVFNHFCGGENINQSKKTIKKLGENNIKTILDYSVEGQDDETSFQNTFNEIIKNIEEAECNKLVPFCVFKMTGIAEFKLLNKVNNKDKLSEKEMVDFQLLNTRLDLICEKAKKNKIPILIDAEESWIQDTIDQLTEAMMKKYNKYEVIIYNTIQLYRSDRLKYLIDLHKKAKKEKYKLGFKLVRGAYMEKERNRAKINNYKSPINISKKKSDEDFNKAAKYCIENIDMINICFGTHNEESTKMIIDLMSEKKKLKIMIIEFIFHNY